MITHIPHCDGIYLGTIVQEGHTTFPIYLHSGYVFNSVLLLERVQIQEGSLQGGFHALGASAWGFFMVLIVVIGVPDSLPGCHPLPSKLTVSCL